MSNRSAPVIPVILALYVTRMLGLFMVLPVLSLYVGEMPGATVFLAGLALAGYGLTQALLQIPFGWFADRFGCKRALLAGLLFFVIGSVVAAQSATITGIIVGRLLQGCGAIAAVLMAVIGVRVLPHRQLLAYASIGISIGISFIIALILGPLLDHRFGLEGIFYLNAALGVLSILLVLFGIRETSRQPQQSGDSVLRQLRQLLQNPSLRAICLAVFALHLTLTANFVSLPLILIHDYNFSAADHWRFYAGVLLCSALLVLPLLARRTVSRWLLLGAMLSMIAVEILLAGNLAVRWLFIGLMVLYFAAFNLLEAGLPVMFTRQIEGRNRSRSMGLFTSAQFFGSFAGGSIGGAVATWWGYSAVFLFGTVTLIIGFLMLWPHGNKAQLQSIQPR